MKPENLDRRQDANIFHQALADVDGEVQAENDPVEREALRNRIYAEVLAAHLPDGHRVSVTPRGRFTSVLIVVRPTTDAEIADLQRQHEATVKRD